jgi:hypothetical protein
VVGVEVTTPELGVEVGSRFRVAVDPDPEPAGRWPTAAEAMPARWRAERRPPGEKWTLSHREQAVSLHAMGMSRAKIAEAVCGDRRFGSTVAEWLRQAAVADGGDGSGEPPTQVVGLD